MAENSSEIYEFEGFRLNVTERSLARPDGSSVQLSERPFETLCVLVRNSGHLVRKGDLLDQVWAGSFVEENNLNKNILTLRRALGEERAGPRFIETVKKHGFRFVADVRKVAPDDGRLMASNGSAAIAAAVPSAGRPTEPDAAGRHQSRWPILALVVAAVLIGAGALGFWYWSPRSSGDIARSIAVLPLRPVAASSRDELYEVGIAESIIHQLSSSRDIFVRPLSATRKYDALDQDPIAAGREQKVDLILDSNYQLADGKVRITAKLYNVASGQIEDTYKIEIDAGNVFAIQDAVALKIGSQLVARFGTNRGPTRIRGTSNEEAYRLYLLGKSLIMRRNRAEAKKAYDYLGQSVQLDPNFAAAFAQLASAYRASVPSDEAASERVKELIGKALELDPELAEAYVVRAEEILLYEWDFAAVEKDLATALELEPNNDQAHWLRGVLLGHRGRLDEALAEIATAQSIDPGAVMYMFHRGRILHYARRDEEAIAQYQQAMDLDDRFVQPYGGMMRVYEARGDYETAFRLFMKREERSPRKDRLESYQKAYETAGWMAVRQLVADTDAAYFDIARLYALQGERDAAFDNLNKAVENRSWFVLTMNVEPAFNNIRDDPRFAALQRRVGLEPR